MTIAQSVVLFVLAAFAEIDGAWLMWQGIREDRSLLFVAGSLLWGMVADGFVPDRYDAVGATICLLGVAVIMLALGVGPVSWPPGTGRVEPKRCRT